MTRLSSVLCAVDASEPAQAAFRQALALSRARHAELAVVVAVPPHEPFNRRGRQRIAKIAALRRAADAAGVRMTVSVQHGDPAKVILLHANARNCDLIVLGTHSRVGLERLRAGSVSEWVARRAACPVLVVPAESLAGGDRSSGAFRHVLCPVDFSIVSNVALEQALRLVSDGEARLTLVHVVPEPAPAGRYPYRLGVPGDVRLIKHDVWQRVQDIVPPELRATIDVRARVVSGTPAEAIVRLATALDADLVVVGVTSRGVFGRRLVGSTAVRVMRSSGRPVLTVPERIRADLRLNTESTSMAAKAA